MGTRAREAALGFDRRKQVLKYLEVFQAAREVPSGNRAVREART
jgi:hypothetical protein